MTLRRKKAVKAWALMNENGTLDTAWISHMKFVQDTRVKNTKRFLKQNAKVVRVLITLAPKPRGGRK